MDLVLPVTYAVDEERKMRTNPEQHHEEPSLEVFSWPTTNGHRVHIALAELELAFKVTPVDLQAGAQRQPWFLELNANGRIPVLRDLDGPDQRPIVLAESGAILLYLAEKVGRLLPKSGAARYRVLEALAFQTASVAPLLGTAHHYRCYADQRIEYAIHRSTAEAQRLYEVMEVQLAIRRFLGGDHFSIADIAAFPWIRHWRRQGIDWRELPRLSEWYREIATRPGVQRGLQVLAKEESAIPFPERPPVRRVQDQLGPD